MPVFHNLGYYATGYFNAIKLFFCFLGHLFCTATNILLRRQPFTWRRMALTIYYTGAKLVIPFVILSGFIAIGMVLTVYDILSRYNLQDEVLYTLQDLLTVDLIPLMIGIALCLQSAIAITGIDLNQLRNMPHETMQEHIVPMVIGLNLTGLLLYTYVMTAFFTTIYLTYCFIIQTNTQEYLFKLTEIMTPNKFLFSLLKTSFYSTIASLTMGYYYYQVAVNNITLQQGISKMISRGLLWLAFTSVYLKLNYF